MKLIIKQAKKELKKLSKEYSGFNNVIVDDWRGYCFIFDTSDVRRCQNKCRSCILYKLLKDRRGGKFNSGLLPANKADKKIFGQQNYLNCKTLEQYSRCYLNFIRKIKNKKELIKELRLISNLKIIYSRGNKVGELEQNYKNFIFIKAISQACSSKRKVIKKYFKLYSHETRPWPGAG